MSRALDDALAVIPVSAHKVRFEAYGLWGVKGICACGWSAAGEGMNGDRVYWLAREHFDDMRALRSSRGVGMTPLDRAAEPQPDIERLCIVMHDAYEEAATEAGWETQARSRKPWGDVPEANKATMRAAVRALIDALDPPPTTVPLDEARAALTRQETTR